MKIALATSDGRYVSKHFGNTPCFLIAEVDGGGWSVVDNRENITACGGENNHKNFTVSIGVISDCGAVIAAQIGGSAQNALNAAGIIPLEKAGFCDEILDGYVKYLSRSKKGRDLCADRQFYK